MYILYIVSGVPKPGVFWVLTPPTFLGLQKKFLGAEKMVGLAKKGHQKNLGEE